MRQPCCMAGGAIEIWVSRERELWKAGIRRWCIEDQSLDEIQGTFAAGLASRGNGDLATWHVLLQL